MRLAPRGLPPVPRERDFTSRLRSPAVAARVGVWLGVCFVVAFVTGLVSHVAQSPTPWFPFPTRPVWGYRVTQGLHVAAGTAAVPLLLVKLWAVFPRLFAGFGRRPRELAIQGVERLSVLVLVSAAVFQLASGLSNSAQWYPWSFSFRATHFAVAWVALGALMVHVAVKLPVVRAALGGDVDADTLDRPGATSAGALSRRGLLRATWLATGAAVVLSAGSTVPLLRRVSLFGVRSGDGPGGVPINKSARAAGVTVTALDPAYALVVSDGTRQRSLTRGDLEALPQATVDLPIACVEGWSATGRWSGVRVRDLTALLGPDVREVRVTSLQQSGPFRVSVLPPAFADDDLTLLALRLDGEELSLDHGYPARIIAPNRPGVLQTKWVSRLDVR